MTYIIDNFYTRAEKLGLKAHTQKQPEIDYCEQFDEFKQYDLVIEEEKFLIDYFNSHRQKSVILSIMFLLFAVLSNVCNLYFLIPSVLFLVYSLILTKKIKIASFEKNVFIGFKEIMLEGRFNKK